MYDLDGLLVVSPTDLTHFLACRHASWRDLQVARGQLPAPPQGVDESLQALLTRGLDHEHAYLQQLKSSGLKVVEISSQSNGRAGLQEAERATEAAMADGADVIYQATFFDGRWRGHADFLLRRDDRPGRWPWSYDVADTKLARRVKVPALLQMATYADRLTALQGVEPLQLVVVTGDRQERPYRFHDAAAYAARVREQLLEFLGEAATGPAPRAEPVSHCSMCRWQPACNSHWRETDDLSLVAFMRRDHARALREAGIETVRALSEQRPDGLPTTIGEVPRVRLVAQSRLQIAERDDGAPHYELLPPEEARGLALLPEPSPGDVFFDIEGDPFLGDTGLEYLFGVWDLTNGFTPIWALDPTQEQRAFEELIDYLMRAWSADPGMHVYHYASYEPVRLKLLSGRYATREAEVDRLLRGGRLVDLYTVVRQGLRVSKESYSIKQLEAFYRGHTRLHEGVSDALGSVVAFERWLATGHEPLLADIASYNRDDCESTRDLRDWLEERRIEAGGDAVIVRPVHGDGMAADPAQEVAGEVERLANRLRSAAQDAAGVEQAAGLELLAGVLDWHRRESLPEWWDFFRRRQLTDEELVDDSASVGLLSAAESVENVDRSSVWRLTFPPQETKIGAGEDAWVDPITGKPVGTVEEVDSEEGRLLLKRSTARGAPTCTSLIPGKPIPDLELRARLRELATWVLERGLDSPSREWRAARELLMRRPPRLDGDGDGAGAGEAAPGPLRLPGEPAEQALCRLASDLRDGVLPVQGPPGTGKTWAGARMVLRLIGEGKRVGITAFSHKAISNLLDAVCAAAAESGVSPRILQKADERQRCASPQVRSTTKPTEVDEQVAAGTVDVVAGTPWQFARPGMRGAVDVLVVDEAGQLSLANVLAMSHAAGSIVLLGDPQQLAQPVKGQHPPGAEASALEHLLAGAATVADDRGLLLDVTWRMHPDVAAYVSAMSYDGRLRTQAGCAMQRIDSDSVIGGTGLRIFPVAHEDNAAASSEEADVVAALCRQVLDDGVWTDRDGVSRPLTPADILVLAPYNAHLHRIRGRLGGLADEGVRVGTVDKFQGQEAPLVIYSMASSTAEDAPRGVDFLYDLNRLNVAVSRAKAVVAIVCSPALLTPQVRTPEQLRMANALCAFADAAIVGAVGAVAATAGSRDRVR